MVRQKAFICFLVERKMRTLIPASCLCGKYRESLASNSLAPVLRPSRNNQSGSVPKWPKFANIYMKISTSFMVIYENKSWPAFLDSAWRNLLIGHVFTVVNFDLCFLLWAVPHFCHKYIRAARKKTGIYFKMWHFFETGHYLCFLLDITWGFKPQREFLGKKKINNVKILPGGLSSFIFFNKQKQDDTQTACDWHPERLI